MNCYTTSHMRTAPQIQRRTFEMRDSNGKRVNVYGVRGPNRDWMLEILRDKWMDLGIAYKTGNTWTLYADGQAFAGKSLTKVVLLAATATESAA